MHCLRALAATGESDADMHVLGNALCVFDIDLDVAIRLIGNVRSGADQRHIVSASRKLLGDSQKRNLRATMDFVETRKREENFHGGTGGNRQPGCKDAPVVRRGSRGR